MEKARPKKRRKVKTSLNSKFVNIDNIRKAQIEAEEARTVEENREEANESDSTLDCIKIE